MPSPRKKFNPFYAVLVLLGVLFSVTACAYGVMVWQSLRLPEADYDAARDSPIFALIDHWGGTLLAVELLLLAVATVGAIALDSRRIARAEASQRAGSDGGASS